MNVEFFKKLKNDKTGQNPSHEKDCLICNIKIY